MSTKASQPEVKVALQRARREAGVKRRRVPDAPLGRAVIYCDNAHRRNRIAETLLHVGCEAAGALGDVSTFMALVPGVTPNRDVDLFVVDIAAYPWSGLAEIESIRATHPCVPIILITSDDPAAMLEGHRLGASETLAAPVDMHDLGRCAAALLEGERPPGSFASLNVDDHWSW